jgi:hypothetical protein
MLPELSGQSKMGFENYNYLGKGSSGVFIPTLSFETRNNWHAELRYNYEDVKTVSVYAGKAFFGGKQLTYSITPMAGFASGTFTGLSLAANTDLEWKNIFLSAQSQYSMATRTGSTDFIFSWSELGYCISKNGFAGLALQYTRQEGTSVTEPGLFAGLEFGNLSLPVYVFRPLHAERFWVVGLTYEMNLNKKQKK